MNSTQRNMHHQGTNGGSIQVSVVILFAPTISNAHTSAASELWDNDGRLINKGAGPLQITFKFEYEARNEVIRDRMMDKWEIQRKSEFPAGSPPLCTEQEWAQFKHLINN
jgi:hypothetical protein